MSVLNLLNQNNDEKEVSGGAIFGYALIGFVIVVVIAFIIFAVISGVKGKSSKDTTPQTQIEQTVETEVTTEN